MNVIIVNDANILIDLIKLKLLTQFFSLNFDFYTTSFILEELYEEQIQELQTYIDNRALNIEELTEQEIIKILLLQAERPQLSEQDCSAIVCAQKLNGDLITSDNTLRKFAITKAINVRGHLWVLDILVANKIITGIKAMDHLKNLRETVNPRLGLPEQECNIRIDYWKTL